MRDIAIQYTAALVMHYTSIYGQYILVIDGTCLPKADTAVANTRPRSAITVNVNGIPISANSIQNARPALVNGTMWP